MISAQAIGMLKASVEHESVEVDTADEDAIVNLCDEIDELRGWLQRVRARTFERFHETRRQAKLPKGTKS